MMMKQLKKKLIRNVGYFSIANKTQLYYNVQLITIFFLFSNSTKKDKNDDNITSTKKPKNDDSNNKNKDNDKNDEKKKDKEGF